MVGLNSSQCRLPKRHFWTFFFFYGPNDEINRAGLENFGEKKKETFVFLHTISIDFSMDISSHPLLIKESSAVDPSVTLPWWDFPIEREAIVGKGEKPYLHH